MESGLSRHGPAGPGPATSPVGLTESLTLLAAVLVVAWILFVPPVVGNADSGDFVKVTRLFSFDAGVPEDDDRWFKYIFVRYRFDPAGRWYSGLPSSEMLLVPPALALNRLLAPPGIVDLRAMGAVHALVALLALALLLPLFRGGGRLRRWALSAAALLVFFDIVYVCYFNSFYMDTAALLFLWLTAVFYLRLVCPDRPRALDGVGFVVSCLLFVTAKSQHSFAGLLLAALIAGRPRRIWPAAPNFARFVIAPMLAAVAVYWMALPPPDYAGTARYNVIFFWILPQSPDPGRDLRELGLDDAYRPNIGTYSYMPASHMEDPAFARDFCTRSSYARLGWFYLRHPSHAVRMARAGLADAALQRGLNGNYAKEAGRPPAAQSYAFSLWSSAKQLVFRSHPWRYGLYCAALCVLCPVVLIRRQRALLEAALTLSAITIAMFLIGALADGADFARHLYAFNACLDVLAFGTAAAVSFPDGIQLRRRP